MSEIFNLHALADRSLRLSSGAYTVQEAALFLRATTPPRDAPLDYWRLSPQKTFVRPSTKAIAAWIRHGLQIRTHQVSSRRRVVTFNDLIRMRMVALLRTRGLTLREILEAEDFARRLSGSMQPFVTEPLWTSGSDVFMKFGKKLIDISRLGQYAMDFISEYLFPVHHGLTFGEDHLAELWRPSELITIDPRVEFGAPCIEGTRVQTEVLWSLNRAGDSPDFLAKVYGLGIEKVRAAIEWEERLALAA